MDIIYILANSLLYDLRVTASLLIDHTRTLCSTPELEAATDIMIDVIRRIEDASYTLNGGEAPNARSPKARLVQEHFSAANDRRSADRSGEPPGAV